MLRRRNVPEKDQSNSFGKEPPKPSAPVIERKKIPLVPLDCCYQEYPCNFQNMVSVNLPVQPTDSRWTVYTMLAGAKLYVGCKTPLEGDTPWWEVGPPQGPRGPYFTTVIKRAEAFRGVVLEYSVRQDTELVFTGPAGGFDAQEEVFNAGYVGYFSCKECEVSVQNSFAAEFVDWEHVNDISELIWSRNQAPVDFITAFNAKYQ